VPTTDLILVTGERIEVEGSLEDVAKTLENAARNTAGTLAWLTAADSGQTVGVNAAHLVILQPAAS
jgi:hypothetical protein